MFQCLMNWFWTSDGGLTMVKSVKFVCPECGKSWEEQQDSSSLWFGYAKTRTLCDECATQSVAKVARNLQQQGAPIRSKAY